jgi:hypothetical protein
MQRRIDAMNKSKIFSIGFSLAVIATLVLSAVPAPALALTAAPAVSNAGSTIRASANPSTDALVCRGFVVWRNGHRIVVRICHRSSDPH